MFAQELVNGDHVAERFGHFLGFQAKHAVVHPVRGEGLMGNRFGLRDFVFVVGEDQVIPAAVDINLFSQVRHIHCRALDMPARTTLAPGTIPGRFAGFGSLPESKIHRMFFAFVHLDARAGVHGVKPPTRELAIVRFGFDHVIHVAIHLVGRTVLNQLADHLNDLRHIFSGSWVFGGWFDIQRVEIGFILLDILIGQLKGIAPQFVGFVDDLVIHIGEVHHKINVITRVLQVSPHDVKHQCRHGMTNVCFSVNCWTANIHPDLAWFEGFEILLGTAEGVVNFQTHNHLPAFIRGLVWQKSSARQRSAKSW